MATYLVDAGLTKLELFAGKGSKNSGISLIGPNSHKNRIRVEIGAKNKQTEVERREKDQPRAYTRLHAPWRVFYVRLSTRTCPRTASRTVAGQQPIWFSVLESRAERRIGLGLTQIRALMRVD